MTFNISVFYNLICITITLFFLLAIPTTVTWQWGIVYIRDQLIALTLAGKLLQQFHNAQRMQRRKEAVRDESETKIAETSGEEFKLSFSYRLFLLSVLLQHLSYSELTWH